MSDTMIPSLARYWRKTLVDEESFVDNVSNDRTHCVAGDILSGKLPGELRDLLQKEWRESIAQKAKNDPGGKTEQARIADEYLSVPVVLLTRALGPDHEHGRSLGGTDKIHFTLRIPAIMNPSGELEVNKEVAPSIPRPYLSPNNENENLPIMGDMTEYDRFISINPLSAKSFSEVTEWCRNLVDSLKDGQTSDGFVKIEISHAVIMNDAIKFGQQLVKLYDVLENESPTPPLFSRICHGNGEKIR